MKITSELFKLAYEAGLKPWYPPNATTRDVNTARFYLNVDTLTRLLSGLDMTVTVSGAKDVAMQFKAWPSRCYIDANGLHGEVSLNLRYDAEGILTQIVGAALQSSINDPASSDSLAPVTFAETARLLSESEIAPCS